MAKRQKQVKYHSMKTKVTGITGRDRGEAKPTSSQPVMGKERKQASRISSGVFEQVYSIVLRIPAGRVMSYGQIARLLGDKYSPRLIGWAMHAIPDDGRNIPWHRVINSRGGISTGRIMVQEPYLQKWLLEAEGVHFDEKDHCDLRLYQWRPLSE